MYRWRDDGILESKLGGVAAVCGGEDTEFSWEVPEPGIVKVVVKG